MRNKKQELIKNSYSIILIFTLLGILGWVLIPEISLQPKPSPKSRVFNISYTYHGKSAEVIEHSVSRPLEGAISQIKGVKQINSSNKRNSGSIQVWVKKHIKPESFRIELGSTIRQVYNQLPKEVDYPSINYKKGDEDFSKEAILIYTLNGNDTPGILSSYLENEILPQFNKIDGLGKIKTYGNKENEYLFDYNTKQLEVLEINQTDLKRAISNAFTDLDLGLSYESSKLNSRSLIRVKLSNSQNTILDNWRNTGVKTVDHKHIRLGELCRLSFKEIPAKQYFRVNGKSNLYINIYPEKGVNHIQLAKETRKLAQELQNQMPPSYRLALLNDNTLQLSGELNQIGIRSLLTVLILLLFVLLVSRSLKYMLLVCTGLIINLGICIIVYYFLGIEMQIYSLAAMTVSLGLLLDNIIIMMDHIRHFRNKNAFISILAASLTTIAALSIVLFLPEEQRMDLYDFALVLIINIGVSVISALFLIPALMEQFPLKKAKVNSRFNYKRKVIYFNSLYFKLILFTKRFRKTCFLIAVWIIGFPTFLMPIQMKDNTFYGHLYNQSFGSNYYQNEIREDIDAVLGGCMRLFYYYVFDNERTYQVKEDKKLHIICKQAAGSNIEQLNNIFLQMESIIGQYSCVKKYITQIHSKAYGQITISFKEGSKNISTAHHLRMALIIKAINSLGMSWNIYGIGKAYTDDGFFYIPQGYSDHHLLIKGYDLQKLDELAQSTINELKKNPRVKDIQFKGSNNFREEHNNKVFTLSKSDQLLETYHIHPYLFLQDLRKYDHSLQTILSKSINGQNISFRLRDKNMLDKDLWSINHRTLSKERPIVLNRLAQIQSDQKSEIIQKQDQAYIRKIELSYAGNYSLGRKWCKDIIDQQNAIFPIGFKVDFTENSLAKYFFGSPTRKPYELILIVVVLIFIICAVLFESLLQPLAIISMIPLSFCGIFLSFYSFNIGFGQGGYASFLLICGIVVNTSIYILNEYSRLQSGKNKCNLHPIKTYIMAFNHKITPILLTILSTIFGMLPFILVGQKGDFWYSLAVGTIGGLIFSLPITFLFLPLFTKMEKQYPTPKQYEK